jgi:hypothetical protein
VSVKQAVTETLRGGFTLRVTMVRENRAYFTERHVDVPWTNKNLTVKWGHFVSKLGPGQKETWTAVITGPDAKRAAAEMVAGLYDASLDAYLPHQWPTGLGVFRIDSSSISSQFENYLRFPGGPANDYITLYITTGFGRMRHLGAGVDVACAVKSLMRLDSWIDQIYREILKHGHKDKNHLSSTIALYL